MTNDSSINILQALTGKKMRLRSEDRNFSRESTHVCPCVYMHKVYLIETNQRMTGWKGIQNPHIFSIESKRMTNHIEIFA